MMEQIDPKDVTEDDIVMDTEGYTTRCVVCNEKLDAEKTDPGTLIRTFSLGESEESVFCTGVMFLCVEHIDNDNAMWCLMQRIKQFAEFTDI